MTIVAFVIFSVGAGDRRHPERRRLRPGDGRSPFPASPSASIAAVLVGGTAIQGGQGSPLRSAIGAVIIAVISNMMVLNDFSTGGRLAVQGGVVVAIVVLLDLLRRAGQFGSDCEPGRNASGPMSLPLIVLVVTWIVIAAITPTFRGQASVFSVLQGFPLVGLAALGLAVTIIAGELDLSVGSMAALAAVIAVQTSAPRPRRLSCRGDGRPALSSARTGHDHRQARHQFAGLHHRHADPAARRSPTCSPTARRS